jgi:hypothetical protein
MNIVSVRPFMVLGKPVQNWRCKSRVLLNVFVGLWRFINPQTIHHPAVGYMCGFMRVLCAVLTRRFAVSKPYLMIHVVFLMMKHGHIKLL